MHIWVTSFRQGHARGAYSSDRFLKRFFGKQSATYTRLLDINRDGF